MKKKFEKGEEKGCRAVISSPLLRLHQLKASLCGPNQSCVSLISSPNYTNWKGHKLLRARERRALPLQLSWLGVSHKVRGRRFNSWSGHMPGLQVRFPDGTHTRGNQSMFLLLFLPPLPALK